MKTVVAILFSLLFSWSWGGASPQLHSRDDSGLSAQSKAKIILLQKQNKLVEIKGAFYNGSNKNINVHYDLLVKKSGQSNSSSNQSGDLKINSKVQEVLSTITVNLNKEDFYSIKLKVYKNNQLTSEDNINFYGYEITKK